MQGITVINKPKDITSFGVAARVRRLCGVKRVGHTGTLDPMATGVLPVLIGRATALEQYMCNSEKRYTARVLLGILTDTEDITGEVLERRAVCVTEADVKNAAAQFTGDILQVPPMYSAIKKDGVRLYSLARKGQTVEREARKIHISEITVRDFEDNSFYMDVCCGKGTYIRSLCRDIGEKLGCGAVMGELVRTHTSGFDIKDAVPLESLTSENIGSYILPAESAVAQYRALCVTNRQAVRFTNGGELDINRTGLKNAAENEILRVKYQNVFLGLGRVCGDEIKVLCVIYDGNGSDFLD